MSQLRRLAVLLAVGLAAPAWAQVSPDDLRPYIGDIVVLEAVTGTFRAFLADVTGTTAGTARFVRWSQAGGVFLANVSTTLILDVEPGFSRPR